MLWNTITCPPSLTTARGARQEDYSCHVLCIRHIISIFQGFCFQYGENFLHSRRVFRSNIYVICAAKHPSKYHQCNIFAMYFRSIIQMYYLTTKIFYLKESRHHQKYLYQLDENILIYFGWFCVEIVTH